MIGGSERSENGKPGGLGTCAVCLLDQNIHDAWRFFVGVPKRPRVEFFVLADLLWVIALMVVEKKHGRQLLHPLAQALPIQEATTSYD